jgi:uncharacterized repeat protein (TIGR04076 family)
MMEKRGQCSYDVGQEFIWKDWDGPAMCGGLKHAIKEFVIMCSLGARSWEKDKSRWCISCVSKKGTSWLLEALPEGGSHWLSS